MGSQDQPRQGQWQARSVGGQGRRSGSELQDGAVGIGIQMQLPQRLARRGWDVAQGSAGRRRRGTRYRLRRRQKLPRRYRPGIMSTRSRTRVAVRTAVGTGRAGGEGARPNRASRRESKHSRSRRQRAGAQAGGPAGRQATGPLYAIPYNAMIVPIVFPWRARRVGVADGQLERQHQGAAALPRWAGISTRLGGTCSWAGAEEPARRGGPGCVCCVGGRARCCDAASPSPPPPACVDSPPPACGAAR